MPQKLTVAVSQSHTLSTTAETIRHLAATTRSAGSRSASLILFPEAYLGGYPRGTAFGASIGGRTDEGREQFRKYFQGAIDLGDTPGAGAGDNWIEKKLPVGKNGVRGDGTREQLEKIARETGLFVVTGVVERSGGSLYCSVVYVDPVRGCVGKRRKVMPTGSERLVWAQGSPSSLKAVTAEIKGLKITLAAAICWENYMPLLRYSLYSQNVNLYLAPTADFRDTWLPLMQTVACEGRCVVLSANQCHRKSNHLEWLREKKKQGGGESNRAPTLPTPNGGYFGKRQSSITKTEDNHEVAWPSPESKSLEAKSNGEVVSPAIIDEEIEEPELTEPLRRSSSIITRSEDNHEYVWPACRNKKPKADTLDVSSSKPPDGSSPLRNSMSAAVEEDDGEEVQTPNEITTTEDRPRRASLVTRTVDNHEISWPGLDKSQKPQPIHGESTKESDGGESDEFVSRGGSCIIDPMGKVLAGPLWEVEDELLMAEVDFEDCERGRLDLDVAGHYSRSDAFKLTVAGLDLDPPP